MKTGHELLHRQPEGFDVGALEGRLDASPIGQLFDRSHTMEFDAGKLSFDLPGNLDC
jgi:hypothetical protein